MLLTQYVYLMYIYNRITIHITILFLSGIQHNLVDFFSSLYYKDIILYCINILLSKNSRLPQKKFHLVVSYAKYMTEMEGVGKGLLVRGRLEARKRIPPTPAIYILNVFCITDQQVKFLQRQALYLLVYLSSNYLYTQKHKHTCSVCSVSQSYHVQPTHKKSYHRPVS